MVCFPFPSIPFLTFSNSAIKNGKGWVNGIGLICVTNRLNAHIRALLAERDNKSATDDTESALRAALEQAKKTVDAAQRALDTYKSLHSANGASNGAAAVNGKENGDEKRRGVTNREMSGEMGGDTKAV